MALALRSESTPFPVQADFRSGNIAGGFSGVVNEPMKMGGVDLRLKFSGDSPGDLYDLTGAAAGYRRLRPMGDWWRKLTPKKVIGI